VTRHQSVANLRSETGFAEWCRRSCAAFICAVVAGAASMPNADVPSPVRSAAHLQNRETRVTGLWQHTEVLPASWPTAHEITSGPADEPSSDSDVTLPAATGELAAPRASQILGSILARCPPWARRWWGSGTDPPRALA
jgi:hypothetical protein